MNLLTIAKKRIVTKLKDDGFIEILGEKHAEYFDYQNGIKTPHLDSRDLVSSTVPGTNTVNRMQASDILRDKRN